tara:strand:+ start:2918 stop:3193 length:276 start_codon:yes stop_codon:yes gene_type:complete
MLNKRLYLVKVVNANSARTYTGISDAGIATARHMAVCMIAALTDDEDLSIVLKDLLQRTNQAIKLAETAYDFIVIIEKVAPNSLDDKGWID